MDEEKINTNKSPVGGMSGVGCLYKRLNNESYRELSNYLSIQNLFELVLKYTYCVLIHAKTKRLNKPRFELLSN